MPGQCCRVDVDARGNNYPNQHASCGPADKVSIADGNRPEGVGVPAIVRTQCETRGVFGMFSVIGGAVGEAVGKAVASMGPGSAKFRVEPDRVFELANRFDEIAAKIDGANSMSAYRLVLRPPGRDKPSVDATDRLIETAFGDAGLITRTRAYAEQLRTAARSLRDTATQYGLADQTEGARFSAAEF